MIDIKEQIKQARQARRCQGDDCEAYHCPTCGAHPLGGLDTFQRCQSCELEEEWFRQEQEGRDAVAAAERAEEVRETPIGEFYEDMDQGVSDSFNPVSGEME